MSHNNDHQPSEENDEDDDAVRSGDFVCSSLKHQLDQLNTERDQNQLTCLSASFLAPDSSQQPMIRATQGRDLLWKTLTHPNSKIKHVCLTEESADAFAHCMVMKSLKKWCKEVPPTNGPRVLNLFFHSESTEKSREVAEDLRETLQQPNNGVVQLTFHGFPMCLSVCQLVLREALMDPNTNVLELCLQFRTHLGWMENSNEADFVALSQAVASPSSKLKTLRMTCDRQPLEGLILLVQGLHDAIHLEKLDMHGFVSGIRKASWSDLVLNPSAVNGGSFSTSGGYLIKRCGRTRKARIPVSASGELETRFMAALTRFLMRPGNKLKSLKLQLSFWGQDQLDLLARAIEHVDCQLEELGFYDCLIGENASLSLLKAMQHPGNRLKRLECEVEGHQAATVLGECLRNLHCKLESLTLKGNQEYLAVEIANALKVSSTNRVRELSISGIREAASLQILGESLRSPNNKVVNMDIGYCMLLPEPIRNEFCRSVRVSNVRRCSIIANPFSTSFGQGFLQVLYTLLSVSDVPRLGGSSPLSLLNIHNFILMIIDTLDWPVKDLSI